MSSAPAHFRPLRRLAVFAILIITAACSQTGAPAPATPPAEAKANLKGLAVKGLPPLGSTFQEFVQTLPENMRAMPTGSPDLKTFEISPPQNIYGDIKSDRLVVQFASPETTTERYWRLIAVAKLPWVCGPEDAKNLFEQEEPAFKNAFEFTKRSVLANGAGASLSGVSKERMLILSVECAGQFLSMKYQYIDLDLFAYPDAAVRQTVEDAYRDR